MDKKHPVGEMVELTMDKLREMIDVNGGGDSDSHAGG